MSENFATVDEEGRLILPGPAVNRFGLLEIWKGPEYTAFRKRVTPFDFSPCVSCASCELAESNEGDCFGNPFPNCGGCLWAQGLIRCP